jgi:hypothetical protein
MYGNFGANITKLSMKQKGYINFIPSLNQNALKNQGMLIPQSLTTTNKGTAKNRSFSRNTENVMSPKYRGGYNQGNPNQRRTAMNQAQQQSPFNNQMINVINKNFDSGQNVSKTHGNISGIGYNQNRTAGMGNENARTHAKRNSNVMNTQPQTMIMTPDNFMANNPLHNDPKIQKYMKASTVAHNTIDASNERRGTFNTYNYTTQ